MTLPETNAADGLADILAGVGNDLIDKLHVPPVPIDIPKPVYFILFGALFIFASMVFGKKRKR